MSTPMIHPLWVKARTTRWRSNTRPRKRHEAHLKMRHEQCFTQKHFPGDQVSSQQPPRRCGHQRSCRFPCFGPHTWLSAAQRQHSRVTLETVSEQILRSCSDLYGCSIWQLCSSMRSSCHSRRAHLARWLSRSLAQPRLQNSQSCLGRPCPVS